MIADGLVAGDALVEHDGAVVEAAADARGEVLGRDRVAVGVLAGERGAAPLVVERAVVRDAFVAAAQRIMPQRYPDPNSPQYTSIPDVE